MSVFSERLSQALKSQGITQAELSSRTGIPKSAISQYLSGKFSPKQDRVYLICKVLGVSPAWITGYDAAVSGKMLLSQPRLSKEESRLLEMFRTDKCFRASVTDLMAGANMPSSPEYDVFRAAKSKDGTVAPKLEKTTSERIKKLTKAKETDEDL